MSNLKMTAKKRKRIALQENEAGKAQFATHIKNGDTGMGNQKFDDALNHYSQAKSTAIDNADKALAKRKYDEAFKTKKTAERNIRTEKKKAEVEQNNLQYAGLATGVGGFMVLLNDGCL